MKLLELKDLFEIKMSPSALRDAASGIDARAGMEFEMIVPNGNTSDEMEPDWDEDGRIRSLDQIVNFFNNSEFSSRRDVEQLENRLIDDYLSSDFLSGRKQREWDDVAEEEVEDYIIRNYGSDLRDQAIEDIRNSDYPEIEQDDPDEFDRVVEKRKEKLIADRVEEVMSEMGEDYDGAFDAWQDGPWREIEFDDFTDWLEDEGMTLMSDVSYRYGMPWPYLISANTNLEAVAEDFSDAIGRPTTWSPAYHGARRQEGSYAIEPDGSIQPDDSNHAGIEFVSPPLPVTDMLDDLKKVKAWAEKVGAYTNESTGLHINISVPGWQGDLRKLDYVKLALLLGDEYVLAQFNRTGNNYAASALQIVKQQIKQRPQDVATLLNQMKEHLSTAAAKLIHTGSTSKYTSINTKDGYIEFRSPGGDWLGANFDKIENTLLRFVVAMDAAVDETKYREEYAKKLYKLLSASAADADVLQLFANYSSGLLSKQLLINRVRNMQAARKEKKAQSNVSPAYSTASNQVTGSET